MTTPQDTFDALASQLTEKEVIELLVDNATMLLNYDDANPDVGMGLFIFQAVDRAADDIREEALRWRRTVYISDSAKAEAEKIIGKNRRR